MTQLRVAIVAGEASGDILGAGLIRALREDFPDLEVEGIGGELMQAQGLKPLYPMERLSVMGLVEVLGRLRELLKARKKLAQHWIDNPPDVFIGVDAPDFNLGLEGMLKEKGIPTVHYVSPSVWAWKRKRIYKIIKTTDLILSLFPFEAQHYAPTGQQVAFVGHPLASMIPGEVDFAAAQRQFVKAGQRTVAILPGSRGSELKYLAEPFLETARWLQARHTDLHFVLPAANQVRYDQLQALVANKFSDLNLTLVLKHSREVMAVADAILIASGTATLEATLLKKPMVVAYKMACLTYAIYSRMIKSPYISLPNVLAQEPLVPEILQDQVRPEVLGAALEKSLEDAEHRAYLHERFAQIHQTLHQDADRKAAQAVTALLTAKGVLHG